MENSFLGTPIAVILILFGLWQHTGQRNTLAELADGTDPKEISPLRGFLIRQARRRMQTGVLFSLSGVAMFAGLRIMPQVYPNLCVGIWMLSVLFLVWAILLTIIDLVAIRIQYKEASRLQHVAREGIRHLRKRAVREKEDENG